VFDLDGVLIDSTACHRAAFKEILRPFGIADFEYSQYAGWRTPEVIAAEFQRRGLPADGETVRAAAEGKTQLARKMLVERNPVADGSREVLEELSRNYRLALASSGSHGSVHSFLRVNRFEKFFQSILSGEDVANAKPDPEIYRKSFAALDLAPESCVVIEDAVSGIEAARRARATAIGLAGTCSAGILREAGAAHVVEHLNDLPALLHTL
jgi:HAD superfamily hydrolase (TIGR01509 family)